MPQYNSTNDNNMKDSTKKTNNNNRIRGYSLLEIKYTRVLQIK
jgi:hypothetical protein